MIHLRLPLPRLPVLLVLVVTVSLGLHHYMFHSTAPQRMRRNAAVPELYSAEQRKMADGASASAKLRSSFDDTAPRGKSIFSSNTIPRNTVIERSGHEEPVLTSSTTSRQPFTTSQVPRCAIGSTLEICEEDDEYDEQIAQAIRVALSNSHIGALLHDPVVGSLLQDSTFTEEDASPGPHLAPRFGPGANYSAACGSRQDMKAISRAHDRNGTWFYVVKQDNILQTINFESCLSDGQKCKLGSSASSNIETTCRQMFIYRKKFVLSHNASKLEEVEILVPSCCSCFISEPHRLPNDQQ